MHEASAPQRPPPRSLLLFTDAYPYGTTEQFLAAELPFLAERFRVVLVPSRVAGAPRDVPSTITVDTSLASSKLPGGWTERLQLWTSPRLAAEIARQPAVLRFRRGLRTVYRYHRQAHRVTAWLRRRLPSLDLPSTLFYTYWFGRESLGVSIAKRRHPTLIHVSRAHGWDIYREVNTPPVLPFQAVQAAAVNKVYAVSDDGLARLLQRFPRLLGRVAVSRLGTDEPGFATPASDDGTLRIVSCSRVTTPKRVGHIVEILASLAHATPQRRIRWDHFGDGEQLEPVRALAAASLPVHVEWRLHGHVAQAKIIEHYRIHPVDLFLNTSLAEGIPVTIMEAQSCSIPVAATAVGGTPEIVGDAGLLLSPDASPAEMAGRISALLDDHDRHTSCRAASRASWSQRYRADVNFRRFASDLEDLLTKSGHTQQGDATA